MCLATPFSARALKENIFFDVHIVKKHKSVKIEIWFIVLCTLIDNEYASLLFSQTFLLYCFCMLSDFAKVFERKADAYKYLICIMQRAHFQVRVGVFNCQQILAKISSVIFDIVIKRKQIECGLAWHW